MAKKYILTFNREKCIGAAACNAAAPNKWKLLDDGKSTLLDNAAKKSDNEEILEFDESQLQEYLDSAQACPVNAIKIKEKDSGKELI